MIQKTFDINFLGETHRGHYITDAQDAFDIIQKLREKDVLFAIDTETEPHFEYLKYPEAGLSPHLSKIRLMQVFDGKNSIVFDLKHIADDEIFLPFLEEKRLIAHNAVFDLSFFKMMGVKRMTIGCTMLLAKLLVHATRPTDIKVSLDALTEHVLGVPILKKMQMSDWSVPELTFEQIEYAALDAICVLEIAEKLSPGLKKFGMERIYNLYKDAQHAIVALQLNGLGMDVEAHRVHIDTWRNELYEARKDVLKLTGLTKLTGHTLAAWLETNLPKEVLGIWPRTETGKLQTDSHVFADFSYLPIAAPFAHFQKLEKLTSSFGDNLIRQINPVTNRIHASFRICGARTGRPSCSNPNLQQFPNDPKYREIFIPSPGHTFICADYNQIEIRIGAEISRDGTMLHAYRTGQDLHALTASKILGVDINTLSKEARDAARKKGKSFNFGLMFGLGAAKYVHYAKKLYGVETTVEKAKDDIETWRELYDGYRHWQIAQAELCKASLSVGTPLGKVRRLDSESYYGAGLNTPIQGGASEVMLSALIRLQEVCENRGYHLVNCVHDEILVQCQDSVEAVAWCKKDVETCMVQGFQDVFPHGITNGLVDVKNGPNWGLAK